MPTDPEKRKAQIRAAQARYQQSEKGKANRARYWQSEKGKARKARHEQSEKGKARKARHEQSEKGKARKARQLWMGGIYRFAAPDIETAERIKEHIRRRMDEFKQGLKARAEAEGGSLGAASSQATT